MGIKELWTLGGLLVVALAFGGCHSGGTVTGRKDAQVYDLALNLPPGCPPASGNENGVGITLHRRAAASAPKPLLCTCDPAFGLQLNGVPCICTHWPDQT